MKHAIKDDKSTHTYAHIYLYKNNRKHEKQN